MAYVAFHVNEMLSQGNNRGVGVKLVGEHKQEKAVFESYTSSYALIIAVSKYKGFPQLPGVKNDADLVSNALRNHGFQVTIKDNPSDARDALASIQNFIREHRDYNSRLLIYYAGHGYASKDGPYLVLSGGDESEHHLPMQKFVEEFESPDIAKHLLVVVDACFSGSMAKYVIKPQAVPPSIGNKLKSRVWTNKGRPLGLPGGICQR